MPSSVSGFVEVILALRAGAVVVVVVVVMVVVVVEEM
ncbi:hypothetical protein E2C01_095241 [Portunus trituberculatus]|uniref:Uncharacterized protein n=1 Tax=Portunus trituberculatus TaxID=210409 RepID=A0A5B7JZN8_PORTR|nr:hypothetical protein [Portunus trituberculatus]